MGFDEINALLKNKSEQEKKTWELERWNWFYILLSQGSKAKKPQDIMMFPWEKKKVKQAKPLTKTQLDRRNKQAQKWLNNRLT
jgi:hypothetical protein